MIRLVLFVEEESMRVLLNALLPRFGLPLEPRVFSFNGKTDLQKRVGDKMRRYADHPGVEPRFLVMRDNDGAECRTVKARLAAICEKDGRPYRVRIVMQEMEAWLVGDLDAMEKAYGERVVAELRKARFRNPDALPKPSEELARLTGTGGKVGRAADVASHLDLASNASPSFRAFCDGVRKLAEIE